MVATRERSSPASCCPASVSRWTGGQVVPAGAGRKPEGTGPTSVSKSGILPDRRGTAVSGHRRFDACDTGRSSCDVFVMRGEMAALRSVSRGQAGRSTAVSSTAMLMLALATLGFAVNFWAWALLSPLGPRMKQALHLTAFQQALLVAVPVVVGSLGRIPVGALTDRFGGRVMFPVVSCLTIIPVLFIGFAGHSSLSALLVGGFFLGVAGTTFAVGVPFVSAWFPPERRGFAIGIFGAGMGGTAVSALTTVKLVKAHGISAPFAITAIALGCS